MQNPQDAAIDAILAQLNGPGGPFAVAPIEVGGQTLPMVATAPPHLPAYFETMCARYNSACFVVDGDERISYAEAYALAGLVARGLITRHHVKPGAHVGIAARNSASSVVLYMGVLMAGGVAALLNGFWRGDELHAAITDTDVDLVFADGPRAKRLSEAALPDHIRVMTFDDGLPVAQALAAFMAPADDHTPLPEIHPDDDATILFTSGSTGRSKGAVSTHRQKVQGTYNYLSQTVALLTYVTQRGQAPKYPPSTLLNVPLFHITGELTVFLQSYALGRKLVTIPKWDAREAMRLIEAERVTYFTGVPLMSFEILTHPDRAQFDLSSCQVFASGGAARPAQHVQRIHDEMGGGEPISGYGLTETNAVGCASFGDVYLAKPTTTGRASAPLVDLAILDDEGKPLPAGTAGEVCIRSIANFKGYWNKPEATAAAFTPDGYFRTGDVGKLDADGYLFIIDRKKDIIIRGGENITCIEVEAALYALPGVTAACVFGLPDERMGELPAAVVTLDAAHSATPDALRAALAATLAAYKVPERLWISPTPLPVLGTGKIDKVSLRKYYTDHYLSEAHAGATTTHA